ncbi:MAG: sugar nucleotide-binding protein [Geminicoccaceae bacterium]|nr:sugar nucleotide-binding protein [Geminicoccaceae bacterium]
MRRRRRKLLFVTGARGFIGRHLVNGPATAKWEIVAPNRTSLDIRHRESTVEAIVGWRPEAVIHLAYDKSSPRTIIDGSRNVAEGAERAGARLVHISTDMIFPGRMAPYVEDSPTRPVTDYGRQKLAAEELVMETASDAVMIRASLVVGTDHLAPIQDDVRRALLTGSEHRHMAFFTDEVRCPAHAEDLAAGIVKVATMHGVTGPLNIAGPEAVSRFELAQITARYLHLDEGRLVATTHEAEGVIRPGRIELDSSLATSLGIECRPVSEALTRVAPTFTRRTSSHL